MIQTERERAEAESRKRIHRVELAALALLLAIPRKRKPQTPAEALALIESLSSGIFTVRQSARNAGLISLGHELAVHGIELPNISLGLAGRFTDAKRAELYARRYAELWRTKFNRFALKEGQERAAKLATREAESRLKSIAVTEANRALNEQKREIAVELQGQTRVRIYEVWDAMRDACPACMERDGEETPVGESFRGDQPGDMHPNCRCESHFITRAI